MNLPAQQARVVTVRCARPLPNGAKVDLVWARGIATPSGAPHSADRRLAYAVRAPFTASFPCERENARADCLPIRPIRLEFSSPVPRAQAEAELAASSCRPHRRGRSPRAAPARAASR